MRSLIELTGVAIGSPSGRPLFEGLNLQLERERVALIGRNGVGKSTLLSVIAGTAEPSAGRVRASSTPRFVPHLLSEPVSPAPAFVPIGGPRGASPGELRRAALSEAMTRGAEIRLGE